MDKNSNHNSVRVLAWYLACLHASGYNVHLFKVYLLTECAYLKCEPQRRREYERRAFVAHKLLLLQPQQVAVVRLGSLCPSSHTAKNFAFIFDIQAQVRLFLPCGSPCVRSTSDCAVLLRSWRTKDGGTMRELPISMRVPTVSPANDEYSCRELSLTEWWEKYRRVRKEGAHLF